MLSQFWLKEQNLLSKVISVGAKWPADITNSSFQLFKRNFFTCQKNRWSKVVRYKLDQAGVPTESFCERNEHIDRLIIQSFGSARPSSRYFLLHYAPLWDSNRQPVPVLLVHGAGFNANVWSSIFQEDAGLMQFLSARGYKVFAITFSHPQGDNYLQAEQLAKAVELVRMETGAPQVDLVAHSKGGMPARIYLSDVLEKCKAVYRGDVRRYIMLATPNLGLDFSFRYPFFNYVIHINGADGTLSWDRMLIQGEMLNTLQYSIYDEGAFPGQCQMLFKWDDIYPLDPYQPDYWTTYYGGTGLYSHSQGIGQAIEQGGNLVNKLEEAGVDASVELAVLAGCKNDYLVPGTGMDGDGIVCLKSVLHTSGLTKHGAKLLAKQVLPLNHLELLFSPLAWEWIKYQLDR